MLNKRDNAEFREALYDSFKQDLFTDSRVMKTASIGRMVDHDAINKCRLSRYGQEVGKIKHMVNKTEDANDMQKLRDKWRDCGNTLDARDFELEDNIALIYWNAYGENFYGGDIIDNPNDGWTCPRCGLKYWMSLKTLPDRCSRCGKETPLGALKKDKILKK